MLLKSIKQLSESRKFQLKQDESGFFERETVDK